MWNNNASTYQNAHFAAFTTMQVTWLICICKAYFLSIEFVTQLLEIYIIKAIYWLNHLAPAFKCLELLFISLQNHTAEL